MAGQRIVVAGAAASSVPRSRTTSLLQGADEVVLADVGHRRVRRERQGARRRPAAVLLRTRGDDSRARASASSAHSDAELFEPGRLPLPRDPSEAGLQELERRREVQAALGVPVERVDASRCRGPRRRRRARRGLLRRGRDGGSGRCHARARPARRATSASRSASRRTRSSSMPSRSCSRRARRRRRLRRSSGVELPVRPLVRQLVETATVAGLPRDLPLIVEAESRVPLPAAR